MGRLYLSQLDDRFDIMEDRALGPWCFVGAEDLFPDWQYLDFPGPFENGASATEASANCATLARYHVGRLTERLNAVHDRSYGFEYWWTILMPWLLMLIEASWWHWLNMRRFTDQHRHDAIHADVSAESEAGVWDFADTRGFLDKGLRSPEFNYRLLSEFVRHLAPQGWTLAPARFGGAPTTECRQLPTPPESTSAVKRFVRRKMGRFLLADAPTLSSANLLFSLYLRILPRRPNDSSPFMEPAVQIPPYFPGGYIAILDRLVDDTLPASFRGNFEEMDQSAASYTTHPGRIHLTAPTILEDKNNFRLAHALHNGERLVRTQHGSGYGTDAYFNVGWLNEYIDTAFLTWGWREQAACTGRFIPVPDPALSRIRNRHRRRDDRIIFVGTSLLVRPFRLTPWNQPTQTSRYRHGKLVFLNALDREPRSSLIYRSYKRSLNEIDEEGYLADRIPDLRFHTGDLQADLLRCRLLVLDHPGTTLNIAMAANVPTTCYWNPRHYHICDEAEPFFAALREARVLFDSAQLAAHHVNAIANDVGAWWNGPAVQTARKRWAHQFARTSSLWWLHWLRVLAQI